MITINKEDYPDVFVDNEEMTTADVQLFNRMLSSDLDIAERIFFENMKNKEEGEFAPSADMIMDEEDNADNIFIVRYYFDEYKIGRGKIHNRSMEVIYTNSLSEALQSDLFTILGKHITLLEWLKSINFDGINYNGNFILNRN